MKRLVFWLLMILLVLSPIGVAELGLRAWGLGDPVLYDSVGSTYAPRPNQHLQRLNGAWVTVGPTGLRGTRDWRLAADRHILFVGDSVTWGGSRIDDHDTFAELVCAQRGQQTGKDMLCGNAGVDAYGIDNMLQRLPEIAGWDTIVVTLIAGDAIRGTTDFKGLPFFSRKPHGPLKASWEAAGILTFRLAETLLKEPHWQDMSDIGRADAALDRLFAVLTQAREAGRQVLLVYSPFEDDVPEQPFSSHIRARLAQSGLASLDMTDAVRRHIGPGLYLDGTHLSVEGEHLYGISIADKLAELDKTAELAKD